MSQLTPLTTHQSPAQADNASMNHIKESLDNINKKMQDQIKHAQKTTEKLQEIHNSIPHVSMHTPTDGHLTYRNALINGTNYCPPAQLPPVNIHEAKLQNRLNIGACQMLIEIQVQNEDPPSNSAPTDPDSTGNFFLLQTIGLQKETATIPHYQMALYDRSPNTGTRNCSSKPTPAKWLPGSRPMQCASYNL